MSSSTDIQSQMCEWEVQWDFGPPEASHHRRLYERQLRTIKKALDGLSDLSPRTPSDDDFLTCCKLAEYIMNCRPLTKPDDDGLPPLRLIDLMVGALELSYDYIYPCVSRPRDVLRKGHRYTQQIAQLWWDRWVNVYSLLSCSNNVRNGKRLDVNSKSAISSCYMKSRLHEYKNIRSPS